MKGCEFLVSPKTCAMDPKSSVGIESATRLAIIKIALNEKGIGFPVVITHSRLRTRSARTTIKFTLRTASPIPTLICATT